MDQVVGMVEKDVGDGESVVQLAVADEGHRGDNPDALFPEGSAVAGQVVKQRPVLVEQPFAQQRIAAEIHQVPIVDAVGVRQIKVDARSA